MMIDRVGTAAARIDTEKNTPQVSNRVGSNGSESDAVRTTFSTDTVSLDSMVDRAMRSAPDRQDRVDAVRAAVQNGTYRTEPGSIATAMLSSFCR